MCAPWWQASVANLLFGVSDQLLVDHRVDLDRQDLLPMLHESSVVLELVPQGIQIIGIGVLPAEVLEEAGYTRIQR